MFFLVRFLISCAITGAILSVIPMVKTKGLGYSMAVAAIMSVLQFLLTILSLPAYFVALFTAIIPFLGGLIAHFSFFVIALIVNTLSLFIADQMVDGFKIDGIGNTAITAVILGICQAVIGSFF